MNKLGRMSEILVLLDQPWRFRNRYIVVSYATSRKICGPTPRYRLKNSYGQCGECGECVDFGPEVRHKRSMNTHGLCTPWPRRPPSTGVARSQQTSASPDYTRYSAPASHLCDSSHPSSPRAFVMNSSARQLSAANRSESKCIKVNQSRSSQVSAALEVGGSSTHTAPRFIRLLPCRTLAPLMPPFLPP